MLATGCSSGGAAIPYACGGGAGTVLDQAELHAPAGRTSHHLDQYIPAPAGIDQLVGVRGGNHLRLFIKETMPELISGARRSICRSTTSPAPRWSLPSSWSQWYDRLGRGIAQRGTRGNWKR